MNLLLLAIAPVLIVILYIYFKDKFEKEPKVLLLKNFLLGATASILITAILGSFAGKLIPLTEEDEEEKEEAIARPRCRSVGIRPNVPRIQLLSMQPTTARAARVRRSTNQVPTLRDSTCRAEQDA